MTEVFAYLGGALFAAAGAFFAYHCATVAAETVARRWAPYRRARGRFGRLAAARYRLGVRLLFPYLERRWMRAREALEAAGGVYDSTSLPPEVRQRRAFAQGAMTELQDVAALLTREPVWRA